MEARNLRQPGIKRNQSSERHTSIKEGAATKLSGLSIRGRGRAPLAEISTSNRENTNSQIQGGPIISGKAGVPFQVYQDDIENSSINGDKNNAKKHCLRAYNQQTKENTTSSQAYSQQARKSQKGTNQSLKHFQSYPDENKPPPAKIANTKNSPPHSSRESKNYGLRDTQNVAKSISSALSTSEKPSFVIHQDNINENLSSYASLKESNYSSKTGEHKIPDTSSAPGSLLFQVSQLKQANSSASTHNSNAHLSVDTSNHPNLDHILSRASAAEFRNSCNDTIRSTSSPATDILERDNDVFSLLRQNNEILEDEDQMDDETTIRGDEENEEAIIGTSEDELEAEIERPAQPVSEAVLISEEYSADILAHVKRTELNYLPKWNYMTKQPDITFPMRSILVDWLVEVSEEYKLHSETVYLAVNYIDRFLSYMSVQRARLQLVGTACMFIAAKYEEIYPPDVTEFVYITDDTYTKKQVLRMEQLVLGVLEFNVTVPTGFFFANHFSQMAGSNEKTTSLARYLTELTLLDADTYLPFVPSIIGASATALARHTLGFAAWDANMVKKTGYAVEDIRMCLIALHRTFSQAKDAAQQAIVEKYKQQKHHGVSEVEPTPIF